MAEFFHYTSKKAFNKISKDGVMKLGLPMIRHRSYLPKKFAFASQKAIFGTTQADDPKWGAEEYNIGSPVIDTVLQDIRTGYTEKIALLKINTDGIKNVFVADWGAHLAMDYMGVRSTPTDVLKRVKQQYADSLIPIDDYSENMNYRLPEVVCFSEIPKDNIEAIFINYQNRVRNNIRRKYNKDLLPESWEIPSSVPCSRLSRFAMGFD